MSNENDFKSILNALEIFSLGIDSNENSSKMLDNIKLMDNLIKDLSIKKESLLIKQNLEKEEIETLKNTIAEDESYQKNLKDHCKSLRSDIKRIDEINQETKKNHSDRIKNIEDNYNKVRC